MPLSQDLPYLSPDEYLEWETYNEMKHEYVQGQTFAMAGSTDAHVTVAGNLFALLKNHLRGKGCRVYMSDMKVRIDSENLFYYPDVFVTCDERDHYSSLYKKYPVLVVEVFSPSTEAFDRGRKFSHYRELASLQEYVLIDPERMSVESFRRNESGQWILYAYNQGDEVDLASVDFQCSMASLYEDAMPFNAQI